MKATTTKDAWSIANRIFPTDYAKDEAASERAGYPIYRSTASGCNAYICELGDRLEVNTDDGNSVNIWIEEKPAGQPTSHEKRREKTLTVESITNHNAADETSTAERRARLTLSTDTTLKDIAQFERETRLLIKAARAASNRGDYVSVIVTRALYTFTTYEDINQESFEMWMGSGADITRDGAHLNPSKIYNDDPARDLWLTGDRGEIFDELAI